MVRRGEVGFAQAHGPLAQALWQRERRGRAVASTRECTQRCKAPLHVDGPVGGDEEEPLEPRRIVVEELVLDYYGRQQAHQVVIEMLTEDKRDDKAQEKQ